MSWMCKCLMLFGLVFSPMAQAQVDDEEIIVYGDRFKRWDKTGCSGPIHRAAASNTEVRYPGCFHILRVVEVSSIDDHG